jgi:hypothetical protein
MPHFEKVERRNSIEPGAESLSIFMRPGTPARFYQIEVHLSPSFCDNLEGAYIIMKTYEVRGRIMFLHSFRQAALAVL